MSYVLGSLGAKNNDVINNLIAQFGAAALDVARLAVKANYTRYQAFNWFRFNDDSIKSSKDKKLEKLLKRDKDMVMTKATGAYKAFEQFIVVPVVVGSTFQPPTKNALKNTAYDIWKQIWAAALGPDDKNDSGDGAGTQSTSDNTLLYVGGAVVLALIAIGASRSREKQA